MDDAAPPKVAKVRRESDEPHLQNLKIDKFAS
jgi:hypothetical protein